MSFITVAGETQIAVKQGGGQPLNVVSFVLANIVGLGVEPVDRIEPMPAPGDIVADLLVTRSGYVNGNQVVYSLTMDSSLGDFDFNWIGLKDDEGVLIAVAYIPTISKTATAGPVPGNNITRNFLIAFSGITATTAIAVPAATWQIDFNARLWGIDGRERLSNLDIYGPAAFFGSGWEVVRQGTTTTYDVLNGLGYVGGIRIDNAATQTITIASPPKAVWLDVSLEGNISDVSAVVAIIADANAHSDYTDSNGFNHFLTKIADIAANGAVTDLRVEADHEAKTDPHSQYLTQAEGNASYDPIGGLAAHAGASDPHSQYLTQAEGNASYDPIGGLAAHAGASDPHSQYLKESDAVSQAAAAAGTSATVRAWSALRVKQAIEANTPTSLGALGTYAILSRTSNASTIVEGTAYSGSGLRYHGVHTYSVVNGNTVGNSTIGGTPPGTWQAMGRANGLSGYKPMTLFVRIS